jgi:hypothetical protein
MGISVFDPLLDSSVQFSLQISFFLPVLFIQLLPALGRTAGGGM